MQKVKSIIQINYIHCIQLSRKILDRKYISLAVIILLFIMFPLGYLESLRLPFPAPKATHGILKGLFLILSFILLAFNKYFHVNPLLKKQNIIVAIFCFSYVVSALFSQDTNSAILFLWYPFIILSITYAFSTIKVSKQQLMFFIYISIILVFITFAFAFFSIMFRYDVDNVYYAIFLDQRAKHLLEEIRGIGKYASLGPYIMLAPICLYFLIQKSASKIRKLLSLMVYCFVVLTAIISNNRIDVLIVFIHYVFLLFIIPRRLALCLLFISVPLVFFGLSVSQKYFGFNLEERILRPHLERDIETIDIRYVYWETAMENFRNFPLFGVGPNAYNDVSDFPLRRYYDAGANNYVWKQDIGIGVHNLFMERLSDTGLVGFFAFILVLFYFFKQDILFLIKHNFKEKTFTYLLFSLGSWSWILYGITDNGYGAQGFVIFFFLRGLINHL